jgi:hypothetical protein
VATDQAEPNPLPGLPRPPDVPAALYQQPGPTPPYTCAPLIAPLLQPDPLLEPPSLPPPGWFADVEVGIVGPHVKNRLRDLVTVGSRAPDVVALGSAELDWTAAPQFNVGYRLPAGFGAVALSYRFLVTDGTGTTPGPDSLASLHSRLDMNDVDLDYISWELFTEQWPYVHMKWFFGLRYSDVYFDSASVQEVAAATAGSGILATHVSNRFWGLGPHAGVELTGALGDVGLHWVGRIDGTINLGRTHQSFTETALDVTGLPVTATTRESNPEATPILNLFLGLNWQPPAYANLYFSLGYMYEYWWDVGRLSTTTSRGELSDQGVLFRAEFNF